MLCGPPGSGKTSIRKVVTQQGHIHEIANTQVITTTSQVIDFQSYKMSDKAVRHFHDLINERITCVIQKIKDMMNRRADDIDNTYVYIPSNRHDSSCEYEVIGSYEESSNYNPSSSSDYEIYESTDKNSQSQSQAEASSPFTADHFIYQDILEPPQEISGHEYMRATECIAEFCFQNNTSTFENRKFRNYFIDIFERFRSFHSQMENFFSKEGRQYGKFWDLGGQPIYHVAHSILLPSNGIYILTFNITQSIDDKINLEDGHKGDITYLQAIAQWLTSIIGSHACHDQVTIDVQGQIYQLTLPVIILVGSHADHIRTKTQQILQFQKFYQDLIKHLPAFKNHLLPSEIIFNSDKRNNTSKTLNFRQECCTKLNDIMKAMLPSLSRQNHLVPIRWYILLYLIRLAIEDHNIATADSHNLNEKQKIGMVMTEQQVQQIAQSYKLYESSQDIRSMLLYLRDLGEIIYCRIENDQGIVVTDAHWFVAILRRLIHVETCSLKNTENDHIYELIDQYGVLSKSFIQLRLRSFNLDGDQMKLILKLLENEDIICLIDLNNSQDDYYLVPHLLRSDGEEFDGSKYTTSEWLYIGYDSIHIPCIPDNIFYRLLSSCVKLWNNQQLQFYYQCAKYFVKDKFHYIVIKKEGSHIGLQYCYQNANDRQYFQSVITIINQSIYKQRPHEHIKNMLEKIITQNLPGFSKVPCGFYVKCALCQQFITIDSGRNASIPDIAYCQDCCLHFSSQAIRDWIRSPDDRTSSRSNEGWT